MKHHIEYTQQALRQLKKLDVALQRRIVSKIDSLADAPRPTGAIKLTARDGYRIRIGDYRVIYGIVDEKLIILIIEIGNRLDIYR